MSIEKSLLEDAKTISEAYGIVITSLTTGELTFLNDQIEEFLSHKKNFENSFPQETLKKISYNRMGEITRSWVLIESDIIRLALSLTMEDLNIYRYHPANKLHTSVLFDIPSHLLNSWQGIIRLDSEALAETLLENSSKVDAHLLLALCDYDISLGVLNPAVLAFIRDESRTDSERLEVAERILFHNIDDEYEAGAEIIREAIDKFLDSKRKEYGLSDIPNSWIAEFIRLSPQPSEEKIVI